MRTTFGRLAAIALIAALASLSITAFAAETTPRAQPVKEAKEPADKPHDQQDKMRYCNAEAGKKQLKGDERKAFMSSCLKG